MADEGKIIGKGGRKRVRCEECRKSHKKCDQEKPRCGNCVFRGLTCVYPVVERLPVPQVRVIEEPPPGTVKKISRCFYGGGFWGGGERGGVFRIVCELNYLLGILFRGRRRRGREKDLFMYGCLVCRMSCKVGGLNLFFYFTPHIFFSAVDRQRVYQFTEWRPPPVQAGGLHQVRGCVVFFFSFFFFFFFFFFFIFLFCHFFILFFLLSSFFFSFFLLSSFSSFFFICFQISLFHCDFERIPKKS